MSTKKKITKVGYLGPTLASGAPDKTTFGFMAAEKFFKDRTDVEYSNFDTHAEICEAVRSEEVDCGVLAAANVVGGVVAETIQGIKQARRQDQSLSIFDETVLPIEMFHLGNGESADHSTTIYSHSKAFEQCSLYVKSLGMKCVPTKSTGEAAYKASTEPGASALASARAETDYKLKRLAPHSVVDVKRNMTRFWLFGRERTRETKEKQYKTAILVGLKQNQSGALLRTLCCFLATEQNEGTYTLKSEEERPNLLMVFPVPIPGKPWEFNFLLEFSGSRNDPAIVNGIQIFDDGTLCLTDAAIIGCYPDETTVTMVP